MSAGGYENPSACGKAHYSCTKGAKQEWRNRKEEEQEKRASESRAQQSPGM